MTRIAITGNIAAGKSEVEKYLQSKGFAIFDADEITHDFLFNNYIKEQLKAAFGEEIFKNGEVHRPSLGKIIFNDEAKKTELEHILHPLIIDEIDRIIRVCKQNEEKIIISAPLLFEVGLDKKFDKIILVTADENLRLKRLMKRNNLSKQEAQARIDSQIPQEEKVSKSTFVLHNNSTFADLKKEIDTILENLND